MSPSNNPRSSPSLSLSEAPTASTSDSPGISFGSDFHLPKNGVITITSLDGDSVTFNISDFWTTNGTMRYMTVHDHEVDDSPDCAIVSVAKCIRREPPNKSSSSQSGGPSNSPSEKPRTSPSASPSTDTLGGGHAFDYGPDGTYHRSNTWFLLKTTTFILILAYIFSAGWDGHDDEKFPIAFPVGVAAVSVFSSWLLEKISFFFFF